ncbi:hypothetical protein [Nitrosospira multiformis]|uniref:hypothetical protein n=1 Tax=Nitrosospira multiformis TaxID=1231 RepID=UPI0008990ED4|nr:hypothetical protein [Nitrosospira multiformis]SEA74161.1 hypothetical protein SAMN05216411_12519 [Nitrosospira multiformis]
MNHYEDWMMDFYRNRMMNDKSGRPVPDTRSLLAKQKLALKQGGKQKRRNEIRLALALGKGGKQE